MLDQLSGIFAQMVTLFAAIAVGYACKKCQVMDEDMDRKLSKLVLSATLPALILASVLDVDALPDPLVMGEIIALSALSFVIFIALSYLITFALRVPDGRRGVYRFMLIFGNTGFIGYPVLTAIFGAHTVIYAVVYNIVFNILVFTFGAWLIASDNEYGVKVRMSWHDFLNPCNVATLATLALALLGVHAVPVVGPALSTVGGFTTPATLLIVGSSLANLPVRGLAGTPRLWVACIAKMAFVPVVIFAALRPFAAGELLSVLVVLASMPVATNGTMLCYQYHGDARTMAQGTFITTVLSLATIPVLATVVGML